MGKPVLAATYLPEDLGQFLPLLRALWTTPPEGDDTILSFWTRNDKKSWHFKLADFLNFDERDFAQISDAFAQQGVYFGLGLRRAGLNPDQRGARNDVMWLPGFALDFDYVTHKRQGAGLKGRAEAEEILSVGPAPAAIVFTGGGLHCHWRFPEPVALRSAEARIQANEAYKSFYRRYQDKADSMGRALDPTHTIDRVWRVPGFLNRKGAKPTRVEIESIDLGATIDPGFVVGESTSVPVLRVVAPVPQAEICPRTLQRIQNASSAPLVQLREALDNDAPFAQEGGRNNALMKLAGALSLLDEERSSTAALAEYARPCLDSMGDDERDGPWFEVFERMLDRSRQTAPVKRAELDARNDHLDFFESDDDEGLDESIKNYAKTLAKHIRNSPSRLNLLKFSALVNGKNYHIFSREKGFLPAVISSSAGPLLRDHVPKKLSEEFEGIQDFIRFFGTTILGGVIRDMNLEKSFYDLKNDQLHLPAAPRRQLSPRFHQSIDEWLRALPEKEKHVETLLDWLSVLTFQNRQCAAMYLSGPPGTGKTLLAQGIGQLWLAAANPVAQIIGARFTSGLCSSPLVHGEEFWSKRGVDLCSEVRALIGCDRRMMEEKFKSPETLLGAVRVVLTANHQNLLHSRSNSVLTDEELEATRVRVIHVPTSDRAKPFLKNSFTEGWVDKFAIAEHCLWLKDQRAQQVLDRGLRFLIAPDRADEKFYLGIGATPDATGLGLSWIADQFRFENCTAAITIKNGEAWIRPSQMTITSSEYNSLRQNFSKEWPRSSKEAKRLLNFYLWPDRKKIGGSWCYQLRIDRLLLDGIEEHPDLKERLEKVGVAT